MFSSNSNEWGTPQKLFDELNKEFDFTLDPCATIENHKCNKFYTAENNGLDKSWKNEIAFVNPPYGREIGKWVEKCYKESDGNGAEAVTTFSLSKLTNFTLPLINLISAL